MRIFCLCLLLFIPRMAPAWQLALGGGLEAADLQASMPTGVMTGWTLVAQWSRESYVASRFVVDLRLSQLGTQAISQGLLERGRAIGVDLLWERRLPLNYRLRPWWGVGAGVRHVRYDDRLRTNLQGYAVSSYPSTRSTDFSVRATIGLPLSPAWSVSLTGSRTIPTNDSTITLDVLWRLL